MSALSAGAACAAAALAAGAGYNAYRWMEQARQRAHHRDMVRASEKALSDGMGSSADARVIAFLERQSMVASSAVAWELPDALARSRWFHAEAHYAGLAGSVSLPGFCMARMKLAAAGACMGAVLGAVFSVPCALVLGFVGLYFGASAPKRALGHRIEWRTQEMERHLPEMLDVIAIGMRSGLSFDRSLQIYAARFPSLLAGEMASAQRKWSSGLERRADALRELAATYRSMVFARVVESIIRALRFGTAMVQGLEDAAREARTAYRAQRQEQVAKAPVKMMIPTGTLILPAMLIMVLGPVLLELMGGGSL